MSKTIFRIPVTISTNDRGEGQTFDSEFLALLPKLWSRAVGIIEAITCVDFSDNVQMEEEAFMKKATVVLHTNNCATQILGIVLTVEEDTILSMRLTVEAFDILDNRFKVIDNMSFMKELTSIVGVPVFENELKYQVYSDTVLAGRVGKNPEPMVPDSLYGANSNSTTESVEVANAQKDNDDLLKEPAVQPEVLKIDEYLTRKETLKQAGATGFKTDRVYRSRMTMKEFLSLPLTTEESCRIQAEKNIRLTTVKDPLEFVNKAVELFGILKTIEIPRTNVAKMLRTSSGKISELKGYNYGPLTLDLIHNFIKRLNENGYFFKPEEKEPANEESKIPVPAPIVKGDKTNNPANPTKAQIRVTEHAEKEEQRKEVEAKEDMVTEILVESKKHGLNHGELKEVFGLHDDEKVERIVKMDLVEFSTEFFLTALDRIEIVGAKAAKRQKEEEEEKAITDARFEEVRNKLLQLMKNGSLDEISALSGIRKASLSAINNRTPEAERTLNGLNRILESLEAVVSLFPDDPLTKIVEPVKTAPAKKQGKAVVLKGLDALASLRNSDTLTVVEVGPGTTHLGVKVPLFEDRHDTEAEELFENKYLHKGPAFYENHITKLYFLNNRRRFNILGRSVSEIALVTGIKEKRLANYANYQNPPSSVDQIAFNIYLTSIASALEKMEALSKV